MTKIKFHVCTSGKLNSKWQHSESQAQIATNEVMMNGRIKSAVVNEDAGCFHMIRKLSDRCTWMKKTGILELK